MTIIKCGFSACKYNSATKPKEIGICQKESVLLEYQEIVDVAHADDYGEGYDGEVDTFDTLDCVDFELDLAKAFN